MRFPAFRRVLLSLAALTLGVGLVGVPGCTVDDEEAPSCAALGGEIKDGKCAKKGSSIGDPNTLEGSCYAPVGCSVLPENRCLAKVDNSQSTHKTLRMSQLRVKEPAVLANGFVQFTIVGPAVTQYDPACLLNPPKGGLFNWLLDVDTSAKTLRTGGARAIDDLASGYCFLSQDFSGIQVEPIVADIDYNEAEGTFATTTPLARLAVPIFQKRGDDDVPILLPLLTTSITDAKLTENGNCIGRYRGEPGELDVRCDCVGRFLKESDVPSERCEEIGGDPTDDAAYAFVGAANIEGKIALDEADQVKVIDLSGSLCVLLTGQSVKGADGYSTCPRNEDGTFTAKVLAKADTTTDDGRPAVTLKAEFAASAVTIKDDAACQ